MCVHTHAYTCTCMLCLPVFPHVVCQPHFGALYDHSLVDKLLINRLNSPAWMNACTRTSQAMPSGLTALITHCKVYVCTYVHTYIRTYVWTISPLCQLAVVLCVIVNQCACTHACTLAFLLSGLSPSSSSLSCFSSSDERNADRQTDRQTGGVTDLIGFPCTHSC